MNPDPTFVYSDTGHSSRVAQNLSNDDSALADLTESALLRARLKQMLMDRRDDLNRISLKELEEDLDDMIEEEEVEESDEEEDIPVVKVTEKKNKNARQSSNANSNIKPKHHKPKSNVLTSSSSRKEQYKKSNVEVVPASVKVGASLGHVSDAFSQIFQALLVVGQVLNVDNPVEAERLGRRSREFEVRMNRMVFGLKQKISTTKASILRRNLHPRDANLENQADSNLHQALRVSNSILSAYLAHLPLSGGMIYPHALDKALDALAMVAEMGSELGYPTVEFRDDVKKLRVAKEKHSRDKNVEEEKEIKVKTPEKRPRAKINMINNLARNRFGTTSSSSPKKTNLKKQKVILPRGNRLLYERAKASRERRLIESKGSTAFDDFGEEENGNILENDESSSVHAMRRTLMDEGDRREGTDVLGTIRSGAFHFEEGKLLETGDVVRSNRSRSVHIDNRAWLADSETGSVAFTKKGHFKSASPRKETIGAGTTRLDLEDEELEHILRCRKPEEKQKLGSFSLCSYDTTARAIGELSDKVTDEIVQDVCKEIMSPDVLADLLEREFLT